MKVLRNLAEVNRHLAQHPDPEVDFNTFNNLKQYRLETGRLKLEEKRRLQNIKKNMECNGC